MYKINEISKRFNIPISTLRYYDKEGLFPDLKKNASGIREFDEKTIDTLRVIECLKKSGLQIKEIKQFMNWCTEGDSSIAERHHLFETRKKAVEKEIQDLKKVLSLLEFKCWYYSQATIDQTEDRVKSLEVADMPKSIAKLYIETHS